MGWDGEPRDTAQLSPHLWMRSLLPTHAGQKQGWTKAAASPELVGFRGWLYMASIPEWWEELQQGWDVQGWIPAGSPTAFLLLKGLTILPLALGVLSSKTALSN